MQYLLNTIGLCYILLANTSFAGDLTYKELYERAIEAFDTDDCQNALPDFEFFRNHNKGYLEKYHDVKHDIGNFSITRGKN